jgi:integrase-like protein
MANRKLLDQVGDVARFRHLSLRTEETYRSWIKRFILFHGKRHPRHLDAAAVRTFLTHLAVKEHVSASTQNQAFNALLFLYRTGSSRGRAEHRRCRTRATFAQVAGSVYESRVKRHHCADEGEPAIDCGALVRRGPANHGGSTIARERPGFCPPQFTIHALRFTIHR